MLTEDHGAWRSRACSVRNGLKQSSGRDPTTGPRRHTVSNGLKRAPIGRLFAGRACPRDKASGADSTATASHVSVVGGGQEVILRVMRLLLLIVVISDKDSPGYVWCAGTLRLFLLEVGTVSGAFVLHVGSDQHTHDTVTTRC